MNSHIGREIRITVDDDEIFERMKTRKRELDLSWEEVLHRGLRRETSVHRRGSHRAPDPVDAPGAFADDLKRQIKGQVRASLQDSLAATSFESDPASPEPLGPGDSSLEDEVGTLESAEDAILRFDYLGDDATEAANQVPLRVRLNASADGLAVEVVAVRRGKNVGHLNAFDRGVRKRIVRGLATGETATLELEAGVEEYAVSPTLSWSREDGRPVVADVDIGEVRFDEE